MLQSHESGTLIVIGNIAAEFLTACLFPFLCQTRNHRYFPSLEN